ncbi:methyltransferase domain-containing protein [Streptomyces bambusae]|uniref:Protein-L-isoaspartate O-methyltransferase n=1 Tax=Streptomyces bambusae TaxID=1550616 RepID=A0ABS6ZC14_9ACTN|nr:methyltransferase domain-containing protein [Streptomyces bambusae]MBW5485131.1 methyltransferase domain-containing protein [Streptomyces bambusae]
MSMTNDAGQAALRGLPGTIAAVLGHPLDRVWEKAVLDVPRHRFLPETIWLGDDLRPCSRTTAPEDWLTAAYADQAVVTQINDGDPPQDADQWWASCSASQPSIVLRMLHMLGVEDGHEVLEIGTGTGWNAALLAHRLGPRHVTSIELDPALAATASENLRALGLHPRLITADGSEPIAGPRVDRLVATCSVRRVPPAWLTQVRAGGIILTPWETPWLCYGLLRLEAGEGGAASGRFSLHSAFMLMRNQRTDLRIFRDVVRDEHVPDESVTSLSPWAVTGPDFAAQFAIGLQLEAVWHTWHDRPDVPGVAARLWLATTDATSWAAVDVAGGREDRFAVWEYGPRRLWTEVHAAHQWWTTMGEPGPERFGMTISPDGHHRAWLDTSDRLVPPYVA